MERIVLGAGQLERFRLPDANVQLLTLPSDSNNPPIQLVPAWSAMLTSQLRLASSLNRLGNSEVTAYELDQDNNRINGRTSIERSADALVDVLTLDKRRKRVVARSMGTSTFLIAHRDYPREIEDSVESVIFSGPVGLKPNPQIVRRFATHMSRGTRDMLLKPRERLYLAAHAIKALGRGIRNPGRIVEESRELGRLHLYPQLKKLAQTIPVGIIGFDQDEIISFSELCQIFRDDPNPPYTILAEAKGRHNPESTSTLDEIAGVILDVQLGLKDPQALRAKYASLGLR